MVINIKTYKGRKLYTSILLQNFPPPPSPTYPRIEISRELLLVAVWVSLEVIILHLNRVIIYYQ